MQVREIMSSPAITVSPTTEIRVVARTMRENVISGVPVVDDNGTLLGMITEMELIARNAPVHEPRYLAVLSALIPVNVFACVSAIPAAALPHRSSPMSLTASARPIPPPRAATAASGSA